jgi:hypothetical protein
LLTIILHVQRVGRIIIIDPSPIIQKPIFFKRAESESKRYSQPYSDAGGGEKCFKKRNAPDAVDVFSDLVRVCALKLREFRGAFDLEEYLFTVGRNDLDWCQKKDPRTKRDVGIR